jgi:hypothetical protein
MKHSRNLSEYLGFLTVILLLNLLIWIRPSIVLQEMR